MTEKQEFYDEKEDSPVTPEDTPLELDHKGRQLYKCHITGEPFFVNAGGFKQTPQGRFLPGGPGGPGRPENNLVEKLRKATASMLQGERLEVLLEKLYQQALSGDIRAAKLILDRTYGQPKQSMELTQSPVQQVIVTLQAAEQEDNETGD